MKVANEIKYSEEKRAQLYRLASGLSSSVISTSVDPTKELVRIASDNNLNDHEIDRVGQKANVLINEHHFRVSNSKDAEHKLADPFEVKKEIKKIGSINKRIPVDEVESAKGLKEKTSSDYSFSPDEVLPVDFKDLGIVPSDSIKKADSEVKIGKGLYESRVELGKYKRAKEEIRVKMNKESAEYESAYQSIKQQLKTAWLTGQEDSFSELYVAGCIRFPDREEKISQALFCMVEELEKEGVMDRDGLLKFSSIPEEYFTKRPRVVDSNRRVIIELDTVTRPRNRYAHWTPLYHFVDDHIKYLVKKIHILENVHREIRGSVEYPWDKKAPQGQYKSSDKNFGIRAEQAILPGA